MNDEERKRITITLEGVVTYSEDYHAKLDNLMRILNRHLFIQFPTFHPIAPFLTVTMNEATETDNRMRIKYLDELKKANPDEVETVRQLGIELKNWAEEQAGTSDFINNLKILWWDSSIGFDCLCGESKEMVMSDESEPKTCDICGRVYAFTTKLELVKDAEIMLPPSWVMG